MFKNYKVLYAEDDAGIRKNIGEILSLLFDDVLLAQDGEKAYELYQNESPDIMVLDIEMPYLNGLEVAEKIRKSNKNIPIVMATAYTDTAYFLKAVELNLTSYILKPIETSDLKKALKKCEEQLSYSKNSEIHINQSAYYNVGERTLYINNSEVRLTNIEMQFLEYMLKNPNRVINYSEFEYNIWEEGMSGPAIRTLVKDLRKHLTKESIQNIPKVGYKLVLQK
ncbi:response regulator transcription factor [Sulfurospirillum diekertiae]|uniref:Two-component response regulator n=3 Tax=Sulfurospirillum TaxID=57665 RepID=A0A1D7TJV3_9BACT|nr:MULTISPECIES: response regulator transcription factor [Sulfurospirillum]AOO65278.1 two-component response regulator [Sulfurospirillum halorespirans DSM 13726]QIR74700.1 response regulator transcription factor [Sulfurospirillum diekertiae]QIR77374.1 response regulator transcription factor [Sulfurospirillum diekertiae]